MAGWPGSYFQVIYPMGASAGTGTAPETPPPAMGGAPGRVAAMPAAGATGAVPGSVVMVSGPPMGSVPAPAAGSGDPTVGDSTCRSSGISRKHSTWTHSHNSTCSSGIGRWHSTSISACDWTSSLCPKRPPPPANTPAGPVVEKSPPVKLMPRSVEVPEPKAETRVMANPMPKYVQIDPQPRPSRSKQSRQRRQLECLGRSTTAAQRRRYEEQLEGQQRKERRTYERADQQDQYDDDNDTWEKGESSDRRSDRDGQDDSWGEWYYRKDWKR